MVGSDIPHVRERLDAEGATALLPQGDVPSSAAVLAGLAADCPRLAMLSRAARAAAAANASDVWYRRRAEWTFEAHDRRLADERRDAAAFAC